MIFGQNYFDVLTSRIGGASSSWNRQGLSNVNSRSKTGGVRGSSRISGAGNGYYGLSANTIKAMNEAFNTTANRSYMADTNVAEGAVKVENAGRKLSYGDIYQEKNTEELLKTVKKTFAGAGSFGQRMRNEAFLTSQAAVTASRFSLNTGIYGSNGRYGTNNLLGGYGGYSSLLSSMFSSWF